MGFATILDTTNAFGVLSHTGNGIAVATDTGAFGGFKLFNRYSFPTGVGTNGYQLTSNGAGLVIWSVPTILGLVGTYNGTSTSGNGLFVVRANNDALAQTGAIGSVTGFSVPALETFQVQGYVNINNVSVDVLNVTVTWTDENSVAQSFIMSATNGTASSPIALSAVKYYSLIPLTIRANPGTIIVSTTLSVSGGSINYDIGATITQIN